MVRKYIDLLDGSRADIITNSDGTTRLVISGAKHYDKTYSKESSARAVMRKKLCLPMKYFMKDDESARVFNRIAMFVRD
ncbi:MAG: hypothetical protein J6Y20_05905, partial [Lachnospiraceae bacterium]|nr:hypothetical protein [Lachnospiraceae bacterium]